MPCSSCVENCSNYEKSQPSMKSYILPSGKQWSWRCLQAVGRAQQRFKFLHSSFLVVQLPEWAVCKGSVFQQFCDKIHSSMHQIFPQMYLTVSIGQSNMERPTELFIKKFFFRWDGHPIFPHLNLPPNKKLPKQVHAILPSFPYPPKQVQKAYEPSRYSSVLLSTS